MKPDSLDLLTVGLPADRFPWLGGALVVAAALHAGVGSTLSRLAPRRAAGVAAARPTEMVDIDVLPPPPPLSLSSPPSPPRPAPTAPDLEPPRSAPAARSVPQSAPHEPAAAARAAAVLTREPDPNAPMDLTSGFVTGSGEPYAGGSTSSNGTQPGGARPGAVGAGRPAAPAPAAPVSVGPDLSRPPVMLGEGRWDCPFPPEADADQVDSAVVGIHVELDANGAPQRITIVSDPGHGFASVARRCAMTRRWSAARGHDGTSQEGSVNVHVRFER